MLEPFGFEEYQTASRRTWQRVYVDHETTYSVLGLASEAGELAGKWKKIFRDKDGVIMEEDRNALLSECGDLLWYLTQIITDLDSSLAEVAQANIVKLADRHRRGVISGNGDFR